MSRQRSFETPAADDAVKSAQLELLRGGLAEQTYPGYPAFSQRLFADPAELEKAADGRLVIPDGPWTVDSHSNRKENDSQPSPDEQRRLAAQGLELDSRGRPLHPWLNDMAPDPTLGVVTGKGAYWQWGPNKTVDPIVINDDKVLLVQRGDTGNWALPGGFKDDGELPETGAIRETKEEAGIIIPETTPAQLVYDGPVVDLRVTANAWPETTAFLFLVDGKMPEPVGGDDADKAAWWPIEDALRPGGLFGSHRFLLQQALRAAGVKP